MKIAIGNVGSTSLKTKIIDIDESGNTHTLGQANLDRVPIEGNSTFKHAVGDSTTQSEQVTVQGFENALHLALDWYKDNRVITSPKDIEAVGFKTVLAGQDRGACVLSNEVLAEMRRFSFVAPAHNMPYVETIEQFRKVLGDTPLVGVFEPSFHNQIPRYRRLTGLPLKLEEELGVEQKGFHGSTGRYGAESVRQIHTEYTSQKKAQFPSPFKLIYNHLGGSSSTHALLDGISIATSMRFSPQSGHYQGTRVGDIDAFAVLYAMQKFGFSVDKMQEVLSKQSGLKGISNIESGEMSDIMKAATHGDVAASLASDAFVDRVKQYIGAYTAVLNGVDAIAFAGGIGENGIDFRARVCEGFQYLGLELDPQKNTTICGTDGRISTDASNVQVYVVQTNEEVVVAYFTREVVKQGRDLAASEMKFKLH